MADETIVSLFLKAAAQYPAQAAYRYFDGSWKNLTYAELLAYAGGIASSVTAAGTRKGDRVAIVSEGRFEWCAAYLGIVMAGGIGVPIDAQLGQNEIRILLEDSSASLVFCSNKTRGNIPGSIRIVDFDSPEFREMLADRAGTELPFLSAGDLASIVYTSGTTGRPKGVMLTHRNFCTDAEAVINARLAAHTDNILSVLPFHHTYPFMCTFLVPLFLGATVTFPAGIKGPEIMKAMQETGVTILVGVPQLIELIRNGILRKIRGLPAPLPLVLLIVLRLCGRLRTMTRLNPGRHIFASAHRALGPGFRFFASGGARLDPSVMADMEALGFTVLEGYGLTETAPVVTFNPLERRKPGSAGRPLPSVEIRIMNPSETGEGEIAIRGPMVMTGYYKNPEETARVFKEGWFLSGDLGYLDQDRYLFITGRAKEVIVLASGKNVYPEDVERMYVSIPLVKEVCVTAADGAGSAESLHAVIVPNLEYARHERIGNIREALHWELNRVSMTLPPYLRLKGFTVSPEPLPRTPLGKLRRFAVRELVKAAGKERRPEKAEDPWLAKDEFGRKAVACIRQQLGEEMPVSSSDNLELDLGLDSLQRIELVTALEKAFSLSLPGAFGAEVQTVGDLVSRLREISASGVSGQKPVSGDIFSGEMTAQEKERIGFRHNLAGWVFLSVALKMLKSVLRIFFRLEVMGMENLPKPPFIIAANHASNMDGFVIGTAVPLKLYRRLFFQGFQTYFTGWWLPRLFGRLAHAIPIDPEGFLGDALRSSSFILRQEGVLCIFPEGGRSFDGRVMPFKKGLGIISLRHNVPVVPALIEGTFGALPRGARWPKCRKVRLTFGRALNPSDLDRSRMPERADEAQFLSDEVRERILGLRSET